MKNKILTTILLAIIIIFSIQLSAQAVIISTDKTVESGSGTVTISVTANQALGAYTLKLTDTAGLTLVSAAGGEISSDKKTITGSSAEGTKNLGTFTFNVPTVDKDTTYNIKFSVTGMETPALEAVSDENNTAVLIVKAPVIQEPEPETPTQPEEPTKPEEPTTPETPNFTDANKTMYASKNINLRASWSTGSEATSIDKGTELKVTATSTNKVNGYVWYRVSYNGKTLYVASNLLTDTKPEEPTQEEPKQEEPVEEPKDDPEEKPAEVTTPHDENEVKDGLKSLEIDGLTLSPAFNSNVYEYRVIVKEDLSELVINAVPVLEGATITIAGNQNLKEGENLITIVVYNEKKEVEATYQITINKNTLDLADTDLMLQMGNKEAKINAMIFVTLLVAEVLALVIVMILKHRNEVKQDSKNEEQVDNGSTEETNNPEDVAATEEDTETEQNVENSSEKSEKEEQLQNETIRPRREKRKGKHF